MPLQMPLKKQMPNFGATAFSITTFSLMTFSKKATLNIKAVGNVMLSVTVQNVVYVVLQKARYMECLYAECHYAECHYTDCRAPKLWVFCLSYERKGRHDIEHNDIPHTNK